MTTEKTKKVEKSNQSLYVVILTLIGILIGVIIAIPLIYSLGRTPGQSSEDEFKNVPTNLTDNECTLPSKNTTVIMYLDDDEPFPYQLYTKLYRPSVILKSVYIIFGFRHDSASWALDKISVNDTTTGDAALYDGDFESNYLRKSYEICILSNTRSSDSDILFDIPYSNDFYYNDRTSVGMTYLKQKIDVTGGRYYNISFYLENRGYASLDKNNTFILLVGYGD